MSQKSPSPARRYLVHRQGTVDSLITQGHNALEVAPHASEYASPYVNDWRLLLDRLEVLTLNTPPANSTKSTDESGFPLDPVEDSVPKRILKETVSYLRTKDAIAPASRDVELAKYKSLVSQVDKYCRKSMLSTVTTSSSPPTIASDKGSTSSLSVPYDQDLPSPSPLKFTFTRTSTNSFAVDVCPEEGGPEAAAGPPPPGTIPTPSTATQTPTLARLDATQATLARRTRSDTVPNTNSSANSANPNPKTLKSRSRSGSMRDAAAGAIPYTSLQGIAIDENAVHDGREPPPSKIKIPLNLTKPIIGKPSKHRHSRSLPALRQEAVAGPAAIAAAAIKTPLPPIPQRPAVHDTDKLIRHTKSTNEFVNSAHFFLGGTFMPPNLSSGPSAPAPPMQILSSHRKSKSKSKERPPMPKKAARESDSQKRWTLHDRDSWEVLPQPSSSIALYPSTSNSSSLEDPVSDGKPKGLVRLRSRFPRSQLYIKTGPLASLSNLGSPAHPRPVPVNVNAVVMGPVGCGVSTLIQKFMTGSNDWVPSSTIDDFWHHVVHSESRTIYYNITEVTGSEEYVDLRRAVLRRAQVVLLCFRLDSREQFRDAIVRLVEDIHTIGEIPIVLVGTFHDSPNREVTADEAQTAAEALHASYFECSPLLGRNVQELFSHAAGVLQAADEIRPTVSPTSPTSSATRTLLNLVRGRRSFSQAQSSPRSRSQSHYVPHSASARQQTFADLGAPVPVLNIAPGSDAGSANVLLLGPQHFKCVIHGGQSSGRKSLVHRYLHGTFEWLPEVPWMTWKAAVNVIPPENERRPSLPIAGTTVPYALTISETSSSRSLDPLRRSTYGGSNVFVLCFAVSDYREEVMLELKERWFDECRSFNPSVPVLVVATKIDQRAGTTRAWTKSQGEAFARSIRAAGYLECSAATGEGIEDVFQAIIRIAAQSHAQSRY